MTDFASIDYFSDQAVSQDPYEYYEYLRAQGPVFREPHHGVVAVTGYAEVMAAFKDHDSFSAANAIGGPFPLCRSHPKAMTSPPRSRRTVISSRSSSTWSSWIRPTTNEPARCWRNC